MAHESADVARQFLRTIRSRSEEHQNALSVLLSTGNYASAIALLRQEIDTFVRLVFLDGCDLATVKKLLDQFADGERWTIRVGSSSGVVTDRAMVQQAAKQYFWTEIAYRFGCSLIHLSRIHDYKTVDPFSRISVADRQQIVQYLGSHHGYRDEDIDMTRFIALLPSVMRKVSGKVHDYAGNLHRRLRIQAR